MHKKIYKLNNHKATSTLLIFLVQILFNRLKKITYAGQDITEIDQ